MKEKKGFDFSQLILLVPVIMMAVLIMPGKTGKSDQMAATPTGTPGAVRMSAPSSSASFNLNGPLSCGGETGEGTVSALIRDHNIIATVSAKPAAHIYLLNGDCIYSWENKAKTGTKVCGVGSLLTLADTFLSGGLGSADTLLSGMGVSDAAGKMGEAKSIMKSCSKAVIDPAAFKVPSGVRFIQQTSSQALPLGD